MLNAKKLLLILNVLRFIRQKIYISHGLFNIVIIIVTLDLDSDFPHKILENILYNSMWCFSIIENVI